jgi:hypothetical protein
VRTFLHRCATGDLFRRPGAVVPTIREVTGLVLRRPDTSTLDEQTCSNTCGHTAANQAAAHVAAFAEMVCEQHGDRPDAWMAAVEAHTLKTLHTASPPACATTTPSYDAGLTLEHKTAGAA